MLGVLGMLEIFVCAHDRPLGWRDDGSKIGRRARAA
jgi:hypothetical protein